MGRARPGDGERAGLTPIESDAELWARRRREDIERATQRREEDEWRATWKAEQARRQREAAAEQVDQLATRIPRALHRELKLYCIEHQRSIAAVVTEAVQEELTRRLANR